LITENEDKTEVLLQVEKLTKKFGDFPAISNLDFSVESGDIFGIAGPNGAGKTTLFNIITGMLPSSSGEIFFNDKKITGLRPCRICHIGIARTFQVPTVFSTMTILENIEVAAHFGRKDGNDSSKIVQEILNIFGLKEKKNLLTESLNLFDKKLTMLAAALATNPKLLLLDEPIGGLSPLEVNNYIFLLKKVHKELSITIVIIEHLMKVLTELAQRLLILRNGEKICIGPPEEVTNNKEVIEAYLGVKYARG
jgi:branched-chain amino acid transport system ATP-binding protein